MGIASSTGAQLFIGGTGSTPAANSTADTATAYAALSYIEVKDVESIGEFGDQATTVTFTSLGDARVRKRKGVRDAGDLNLVCGNNGLDPGQKALITAQTTEFTYPFKVLLADAADANDTDSVSYFRALVSNARLAIGAANEIVKRNFALLIDSKVIEIPTVAVSG